MLSRNLALSVSLLAIASPVMAQLPYNPLRLILSPDKSKVYQFSSQGSQVSFSYLDLSEQVNSASLPVGIHQPAPFQLSNEAYLPVVDNDGMTVLTGSCEGSAKEAELWRFTFNKDGRTGTWKTLPLGSSDTIPRANYLSAGFTFSPSGSVSNTSMYVFGGMCPDAASNGTSWISKATYSNTMVSVSVMNSQQPQQLSVTGARAPPVAEAGLTITPLSPVSTTSSVGKTTQQQNFMLLGGHTQNAFINMSQVALFSLPEASWAFVGVNQPSDSTGELLRRDSIKVEPRSGHTAVMSDDGSKIVVFGGWVGDTSNPATPQLAVLQLGQGYGGTGAWQWVIPKQKDSPIPSGQGLYGHGAAMLPGNIMLVSGGNTITASKSKRATQNYMFYNIDTGSWLSTYKGSVTDNSSGLDSKKRAGIGAGLGLGLTAIILAVVVWWFYRKKMREKRAERERHLRELAFGSERFQSSSRIPSRTEGRFGHSDMRSSSWGSRQEQNIENTGFSFPWSGQQNQGERWNEGASRQVEVSRTGTEIPSPTRGLRKPVPGRGFTSFGNYPKTTTGPGSVFRIDEVEEEGSVRSLQVKTPTGSRLSDPFKDPPNVETDPAAQERKREVQGWVEDWQSAAVNMNISRNPSQARTYSNLSQAQSSSESSSYRTGRESPEKSDRTGSNLSERSELSLQRSVGTVSRQISQRSVSAGYALFAGAAAAMSRLGGANKETSLDRATSKRSISLNTAPPRRTLSGTQRPISGESRSLLSDHSPTKSTAGDDSPIKDYKNYSRTSSLASQRKKMGILGSVKRVFTGTSQVNVQAQVEHYEDKADSISPTIAEPEMSESGAGPAFWRGKRGAKDWDEDETYNHQPSSATTKRRSTIDGASNLDDYDGEEWDVETAIQKRVVQVMFTVPKEKLRVVNADALSLVSRSDVDEREDRERKSELKRMSSVREDEDGGLGDESINEKGKGKGTEPGV